MKIKFLVVCILALYGCTTHIDANTITKANKACENNLGLRIIVVHNGALSDNKPYYIECLDGAVFYWGSLPRKENLDLEFTAEKPSESE